MTTDNAVHGDGRILVASSAGKPARGRRRVRKFASPLIAATASLGLLAAAVGGATAPPSQLAYQPIGHWVYNVVQQAAFHVDGPTTNVDAKVPVASESGTQVVQDDTNGYVVGQNRIVRFGKSNLRVEGTTVPPSNEVPFAIEAVGGPYLVYRKSAKIVRLGVTPQVIPTGDAVADPVVTGDGTMWLLHPATGLLCELPRTAVTASVCPAVLPSGHAGALTVLASGPHVLDLTAGLLRSVGQNGLGAARPVGVPTSAASVLAPADAAGRLPILNPAKHTLYLVDPNPSGGKPVTVDLGPGEYEGPLSSGPLVALVNKSTGTLVTYDNSGHRKDAKVIPVSDGPPAIVRGADGRVYVQNGGGTHLLVVGKDGKVDDAPVIGNPGPVPTSSPSPSASASQPPVNQVPPANNPPANNPPANNGPANPLVNNPPAAAPSAPGAPSGVSASAGSGSVTASWRPAAANRANISGYVVTWHASSGASGSRVVSGTSRSTTVSGLANGVSYTFSVAARNRVGDGPAAAADPVTPAAVAAAPGALTAEADGTTAKLGWLPPNLNGGTFVRYQVTATGQSSRSVSIPAATFSGLTKGASVTFTVRAITRAADGRTLTGAAASRTVRIPKATITVSRGPHNCSSQYPQENCYRMHVVLAGFAANQHYELKPHSDDPNYSNGGSGQDTNSNGYAEFNAFEYYGVGNHVWVSTDDGTVTSNHFLW